MYKKLLGFFVIFGSDPTGASIMDIAHNYLHFGGKGGCA